MINSLIDTPDFIGHRDIRQSIENAILKGNITHAHILYGEDGIGKSLIAEETAIKILGKEKIQDYPDIIRFKIGKEKQSIGVDEIRGLIQEINKTPSEGDKKVIVIYQGDKITEQAQNAFLKTVEEPPSGVFIIILCENLDNILDTIKSRCQIHKLQKLNTEEMKEFLVKKKQILNEEELKTVIAFSDGIPGRAEKFFHDKVFKEIRSVCLEILMLSCSKTMRDTFKYENFFVKHKEQWQEILMWLLSFIRDIMVYKETQNEGLVMNLDKLESIKEMSSMFSYIKLNKIVEAINNAQDKMQRNVNLVITFDVMLFKMQEE